ncbi:sensor histidine kinase [Halobaculum litoreum]|uniref:histidine kinase n=1 Tax=Halobaculum litoreum TaxID=3031998 RepID=A0ABD5XPZ1_9EURY|nr:ATP-binding protein [Halobaculum sp. DT92]
MSGIDDAIRVLYVDDDDDLRDLFAVGLERHDDRFDVTTASSVAAGLDRVRTGAPDCVVSDYSMPGGTGIAFLRRLRETDPELPFILFAETGDERVASEAISAGVTDYVVRDAVESQHALLARKIETYVARRRAERRATETNERLRELASVADDVLWTFSPDWSQLLFINGEAHERLFGQSAERLYEEPASFLERIHPDDRDRVRLAMERASGGTPQSVEYRIRQSDSVEVWAESHCEPVVEDGEVVRMTGFTHEITDRKLRERELANANERLDRFASTIAHDLRNPVNVASGHLDLVRETGELDHLDPVERGIDRIDELLSDLLTLARSGDDIGDTRAVDLAEVVESAEGTVAMAGATLRIDSSGPVECDPARLREAIENLLRNAIEHNDETVTIAVGLLDDGTGFYVADDGVGIPESEREEVFAGGYTTVRKGTGYGLSIVERIAAAHGWTVTVVESADGGARFEFTDVAVGGE